MAPTLTTAVFVATGAFDCGKTTTLEWLREHHGVRIHREAHLRALDRLGARTTGHPPGQGFTHIDDPAHLCPMCRPWDFAELVLDEQRMIESAAQSGDVLERGWIDPIEMLLRNTAAGDDAPHPEWTPLTRYAGVMLFDVMPELQSPRWGKPASVRSEEARAINVRLERLYRAAGHEVMRIAAGSVADRGARVLELITSKKGRSRLRARPA